MARYKVGTHINLTEKDDITTRVARFIAPYLVGALASYGFWDLILTANGY